MLAITYIVLVDVEFFMQIFGNSSFYPDSNFSCSDGKTLQPLDNSFSAYLFGYDLCITVFSMMIFAIFFGIPWRSGFISTELKRKHLPTANMTVSEKQLRQFLP
mmetsp:Transcript_39528/g.29198  ORF Transcript_39528/g.29198 Transcript_39528/m.29198 type:complete len:104 (+) Transcript_39528:223-534(+)